MKNQIPQIEIVKKNIETIFSQYEELKQMLSLPDKKSNVFKECDKYFEKKRFLLKQIRDNKYYIAFIGTYSAGKSTLINAILKRDILPENLEKATTAFPTYLFAVPKEQKEKAEIIYYNQNEREQLKSFYLNLLKNDFDSIDINEFSKYDTETLLQEIEELKEEYEDYDEKIIETFQNLLKHWNTKIGETDTVTIEEVKSFVESNENSVIISRADVYLNESLFSGRNDIVLVDLPGVDADNPRHFETTKKFTLEDAKSHAYIYVSAPEKVESEKANEFLFSLAKHTKQINKAFWVLNRCDQYKDKNEVLKSKDNFIANNLKKIRTIDEKRVFAVSAKLYKENSSSTNELVQEIDQLRERFTIYLKNEFELELASVNQKEYELLKEKLLAFLKTKVASIGLIDDADKHLAVQLELVENSLEEWKNDTLQTIEKVKEEISESINNLQFINDKITQEIREKIDNRITEFSENKNNFIDYPKDIDAKNAEMKISDFQNNIHLNLYIRDAFANALLNEGSISEIINSFNVLLYNHTEIFKQRELIYSEILQRFEGICDITLMSYRKLFDECIELNSSATSYELLFILLNTDEDDLYNFITILVNKNNKTDKLINFILSKQTSEEMISSIIEELGIENEYNEYYSSDNDNNLYIQKLVKYKMYQYLDNLKGTLNKYVAVSLTNYFKDIFQSAKETLNSSELLLKKRLHFTKLLQEKSDEIGSETAKKEKIYKLYLAINE